MARTLLGSVLVFLSCCATQLALGAEGPRRPNIVFIMADDK